MRSFNVPFQKVSETSTTLTVDADLDVNGDVSPDGIYLGGSTSANYLDDYEEGSWTPDVSFGGSTTGITYSIQYGYYVKINLTVFIQFRVRLSSKGSATGDILVSGLPFNQNYPASFNVDYAPLFCTAYTPSSGYTNSMIIIQSSGVGTTFLLREMDISTGGLHTFDDTEISTGKDLIGKFFYETTA